MKISTKLLIIVLLPITVGVLICYACIRANQQIQHYIAQDDIFRSTVNNIGELHIFTYEYLRFKYDRPRIQWLSQHKELEKNLSKIAAKNPNEKIILARVLKRNENIHNIFLDIVNNNSSLEQKSNVLIVELNNRLIGQLITNLRAISNDATMLQKQSAKHFSEVYFKSSVVLVLSIILAAIIVIVFFILLRRSITRPIKELLIGTEKLGAGDLSYRITANSTDEIGALASEFNKMANKILRASETLQIALDTSQRSQRMLEESEHRMHSIINNATAIISLKDKNGIYIQVNDRFEKVTERHKDLIIGKSDFDVFPLELAEIFTKNDKLVLSKKVPLEFDEQVYVTGKDARTYLSIKFLIYTTLMEIYAICTMSTDITERRIAENKVHDLNIELEQRVEKRTAQLKASNKELDSFCHTVSHDLRAPLRVINGFASNLIEDFKGKLDMEGQDSLVRISNAATRMEQLINDLLNFSRMARKDIYFQPVDLTMIVSDIFLRLREANPGRSVDCIIKPGMAINADLNLIKVVMENLIGNAWKYTSHKLDAVIEIGILQHDDRQVYYVKDDGTGFDMAYVDKIFDPFQRLHKESEFEGTGIGLATVRRIIAKHGGKIWAESEIGSGATFFFDC